jgi:Zinc finger, C3HC4 type (RING finger)
MSDIKDILVLPCRHLCMCKTCAELLRLQGRDLNGMATRQGPPKCPICRQLFHSLIQIKLPPAYQWKLNSRVSLNVEGKNSATAS